MSFYKFGKLKRQEGLKFVKQFKAFKSLILLKFKSNKVKSRFAKRYLISLLNCAHGGACTHNCTNRFYHLLPPQAWGSAIWLLSIAKETELWACEMTTSLFSLISFQNVDFMRSFEKYPFTMGLKYKAAAESEKQTTWKSSKC